MQPPLFRKLAWDVFNILGIVSRSPAKTDALLASVEPSQNANCNIFVS